MNPICIAPYTESMPCNIKARDEDQHDDQKYIPILIPLTHMICTTLDITKYEISNKDNLIIEKL